MIIFLTDCPVCAVGIIFVVFWGTKDDLALAVAIGDQQRLQDRIEPVS